MRRQALAGAAIPGLVDLLRCGSDSGRQAAARALRHMSAGMDNPHKARTATFHGNPGVHRRCTANVY